MRVIGFCLAGIMSGAFGVVDAGVSASATSFSEDLTVERFGHSHVGARFVFRSHWVPQARHRCQDHEDWHEGREARFRESRGKARTGQAERLCHFEAVFPRAVGVLLDRFKASLLVGCPSCASHDVLWSSAVVVLCTVKHRQH